MIRESFNAAAFAVSRAGLALVALLLSLVIVVAGMLRAAFVALRGVVVGLSRALCVAACVAGVVWAFVPLVEAFGGDVVAVIPAAMLLLSPVAFVLHIGASWGGLLVAGVLAVVLGTAIPALSPVVRAGALMVVIGVAFVYSIQHRRLSHVRQVEREVDGCR